MKILVFSHVTGEGADRIESIVTQYGHTLQYFHLQANGSLPRLTGAGHGPFGSKPDALLFLGGPMSVNGPDEFLAEETHLIQEALKYGNPILGICLGAQLIAKATGARVYRAPRKEIGWRPVYWTEAACNDPLLENLRQPELMFHWHGETFDLPSGAEWLAWSDDCRNQAFRLSDRVYGFQFHPEVSPGTIENWLQQDLACGELREATEPIDPNAHAERQAEVAAQIFGAWARLIERLL